MNVLNKLIYCSIIIVSVGIGWFGYAALEYYNEKKLVVIIPSYNNAQWCEKNLESVFSQNYHNYRVIYVDDCSNDDTYQMVKQYIDTHNQWHRVTLLHNEQRRGAMSNWYTSISTCADDEIIINLDGDDWFKHAYVLQRINREYQNPDVWLTYGQFEFYPSNQVGYCHALPQNVIDNNLYRYYPVVPSHLRTFYAWLFKKIKTEDLMLNGEFFPATCDQAMLFPMLEMAREHVRFIPDILYVYNQTNPINDNKVRLQMVLNCERIIRKRARYDKI